MAEEKHTLDEFKLADKALTVDELIKRAQKRAAKLEKDENKRKKMELGKLKEYTLEALERHMLIKLNHAEERIKPTNPGNKWTKFLHDATHGGESIEFILATSAIIFNPRFGIFPLMTGLASIIGIIAGCIEWKQLRDRSIKLEEDHQAIEQLLMALLEYQNKVKALANNKETDAYLILKHVIAYWEVRLQRNELNLKRLDNERWVARAAVLISVTALVLILTTSINIELMLLSMIVIDKLIHAIYAVIKTQQADDELIPLGDVVAQKGDAFINKKLSDTQDRVKKRNWKQWIHGIALLCATLSLVIAPLSVSPLTIIILLSTAMVMDGGTKFFWFIYHYIRFQNKKQLENDEKENRIESTNTLSNSSEPKNNDYEQATQSLQEKYGSLELSWCSFHSRKNSAHHNRNSTSDNDSPSIIASF